MPKAEPTLADVRAAIRAAGDVPAELLLDEAAAVVRMMLAPDPLASMAEEAHKGAGAQQAVQMLMRRLAARLGERAPSLAPEAFGMQELTNSSTIAAVGYDPDSQTLRVRFAAGGIYLYEGVPEEIFTELVSAPSPGSFFARRVRKAYSGRKSGEPEVD